MIRPISYLVMTLGNIYRPCDMRPCIGNQPFYTFRNIGYDVLVYILPCVHILFLLLIHAKITIMVQITGGCTKHIRKKIVARIEVEAIDKYIAKNAKDSILAIEAGGRQNSRCPPEERMAYIAKKEIEDAGKQASFISIFHSSQSSR